MEEHRELLKKEPAYRERKLQIERFTRRYVRTNAREGLRSGIVIIPVVVHVVHNTAAQNISDAQINSQIAVLNQDFRRLNPDVAGVPAAFQPLAADARIEFRLAVRDPNCNPTTGITRTETSVTSFPRAGNPVKSAATGGADPWPSDRYLNVWVCRLSGVLLGYAHFPGGPAATDGVVIRDTAFGNTGTAAAPFDRGRTATHEIGHWLNLAHIWGDEEVGCGGSDNVGDTPNQADENYGCPAFPQVSCGNGPNGDMFMNYMDYTDDACMFMLTAGQAGRMDATLYGPRSSIVASDGLVPPPPSPGVDLWSKDRPEDTGAEPDPSPLPMWESDDIWVRRQNDGVTNQEHQNPEHRDPGGPDNFVYVRVRNRACRGAANGTLKLYWAKASTALSWPAPWDGSVSSPALMGGLVGSQPTGSVPAGGSTILQFAWRPPNPDDYAVFGGDRSHFCLLGRIETAPTAPFGMTFPETTNLYANVQNNNNIVWKNITVVDEVPGGGRMAWTSVGALAGEEVTIGRLTFTAPGEDRKQELERSLFDWGTIAVDLGPDLIERWRDGGAAGERIDLIDDTTIVVAESGAWIGNLKFEPGELYTIGVHFEPKGDRETNEVFFFEVTQYASGEDREEVPVGGMRFVMKTRYREQRRGVLDQVLTFNGAEFLRPQLHTILG